MKPVFGQVEEQQISFFRVNHKVNYRAEFLWHFHHVYELNLILKGAGRRFVGDSIAHYERGDLVLMSPELPHTWHGTAPHESIGLQFSADFLGRGLLEHPEWQDLKSLLSRAARGLEFNGRTRAAAQRQVEELVKLKGLPRLVGFLHTLDLLARSRECHPLCGQEYTPVLRHDHERRIDKVCSYLSRQYTGHVTQPEAAAIAGMSVSAFSHFFKTTMGRSFTDYVIELRIGHACKLLIETEDSIAGIAYAAGFNNLANFNRRFIAVKHVPPKVYRKQFAVLDQRLPVVTGDIIAGGKPDKAQQEGSCDKT
jgi:AraC-like DNA-binding protein